MFIIPVPSTCCSEFDSTPLELIIWWHKCCSFLPQETFSEKIKLESSKFCAKCHSNRSSCCSQIIPKTVRLTKKSRKEKWRIDFLFPPKTDVWDKLMSRITKGHQSIVLNNKAVMPLPQPVWISPPLWWCCWTGWSLPEQVLASSVSAQLSSWHQPRLFPSAVSLSSWQPWSEPVAEATLCSCLGWDWRGEKINQSKRCSWLYFFLNVLFWPGFKKA